MRRQGNRGGEIFVELVRLAIVVLVTGIGFAVSPVVDELLELGDPERTRLLSSLMGALIGYLVGGVGGRQLIRGVDEAQQRLQSIDAAVLISTTLGAALGGALGVVLTWPTLLLPAKQFTLPAAMVVLLTLVYGGGRVGLARGGDLLRFVGARGRLQVSTPSRGGGTKLVDTSALIDGRLVEVARAGFLEGTLVVPRFVLEELQSLADSEQRSRRHRGRRGLDTLTVLQDEGVVGVEVTDEDVPGISDVDARLAHICRQRQAALVTVDANLARVAEISGVRTLNLHTLAEALRAPVLPGDRVRIEITREGREEGQGVGYLPDATMVVVEHAAGQVGSWVSADVTSVMQTRQGRMLFANVAEEQVGPAPRGAAEGEVQGGQAAGDRASRRPPRGGESRTGQPPREGSVAGGTVADEGAA